MRFFPKISKTLCILLCLIFFTSIINASASSTSTSGTCDATNNGTFYYGINTNWNAYLAIKDNGDMILNSVDNVGSTFDYIFPCGQMLSGSVDPGGFLVKKNSSGVITDCDITQTATSGILPTLDTTFHPLNNTTTGCYNGANGGIFNYNIPFDSKYDGAKGSLTMKVTATGAIGSGFVTTDLKPTCTRTINFTIKCPEKWIQSQSGSIYLKGDQTNPISPNLPKKAVNYTIKDIVSSSYTNIHDNGTGAIPATTTTTRTNCGISDQSNMFTGISTCSAEADDFASSYFLFTGVDSTRRAKPISSTAAATQVSKYGLFSDSSELRMFEPYLMYDTQPQTIYDYYKNLIKSNNQCNNYYSRNGFVIPVGSGDLKSQLFTASSLVSPQTGTSCTTNIDTLDVSGNLYINSGNWTIQSNIIVLVSGDLILNGDIIKTMIDKNILFVVKGNVKIGAGNYKSSSLTILDYPNYDRLDVNIITDGKYMTFKDNKVDNDVDPSINTTISTSKVIYDGLQINGSVVISNMCPNNRINPLYNSSIISSLILGNTCVSNFARDLNTMQNFIAPAEQYIYDASVLNSFAESFGSSAKYSIKETGYDPRQ